MEIISIILLLVMQAKTQDILVDNTASGDGDSITLTTVAAFLIDDNGDIQNISTYDSFSSAVITTMDNETISKLFSNGSILYPDTTEDITSTMSFVDTTMAVTAKPDAQITLSTADASTTVTAVETTTITDVPTATTSIKETTTTTIVTTTKKPSTTSLTSTTGLPSTVTEKTEFKQTTIKVPQMPTVGTTHIPANEDDPCSFMDDNLKCDEDIVCYGEGNIDCSDEVETYPAVATFIGKLSSVPEDYSDYDDDGGDGVETFPPYLVGVKSDTKKLPFLFRIGSLGTTPSDSDNSETVQETTLTTETPIESANLPFIEELTSKKADEELETIEADTETRDFLNKITKATSNVEEPSSFSYSATSLPSAQTGQEESEKILPSTAEPMTVATTIQDTLKTMQNVTSRIITALSTESSAVTEDSHIKPVYVRRRREENFELGSDSSSSLAFRMSALESSKEMRVKACRLTGNLVCTPSPTVVICKGRTVCQAVSGAAETSEKSTSAKGVESWAIAVIAICAIAAALTVSLLVYLVFTSWKKLKVQPQNGVTTLTYVNSSVP